MNQPLLSSSPCDSQLLILEASKFCNGKFVFPGIANSIKHKCSLQCGFWARTQIRNGLRNRREWKCSCPSGPLGVCFLPSACPGCTLFPLLPPFLLPMHLSVERSTHFWCSLLWSQCSLSCASLIIKVVKPCLFEGRSCRLLTATDWLIKARILWLISMLLSGASPICDGL